MRSKEIYTKIPRQGFYPWIQRSRSTQCDAVYREWRKIVVKQRVTGVQVHDARLAAVMYVHGLRHILTFNAADFSRFDGLVAVHPESVRLRI